MRPRQLTACEIEELLAAPVPCRLATIDRDGFPRVTPLWFVWDGGHFWMTSLSDRRHLADLTMNDRAGLCVDVEESGPPESPHRPNRQVTARGRARLLGGRDGEWTRRITLKYVQGPVGAQHADARAAEPRTVICFSPEKLTAFGAP
jgi:nitroimidazol reductase NimA-like FMN-containing flavoprotein (pyridoxamine 5'-phosphate oxidase superfamily)